MCQRLDVFFGRVSQHTAHVYVRAPDLPGGGDWTIAGQVRGPHCRLASTLPATTRLRDLGVGPTLMGEAIVPDPCFWSPRLPALYDVQVQLLAGGRAEHRLQRSLGLRLLGTAGSNLILEGKRWVLRGADEAGVAPSELADWRETAAAILVTDPPEELCRQASQQGVMLVARLDVSQPLAAQCARLSQWAAVVVAILPDEVSAGEPFESVAPNILLAQAFQDTDPIQPASWAQLAVCEVSDLQRFATATRGCRLPIIALRKSRDDRSLLAARAECDRLQRDLAPWGDFAGYIV